MSSFLGHSLAAATVYIATESIHQPLSFVDHLKNLIGKRNRCLWLLWLVVVASIPDLDYVIKAWQSNNNKGLRITHSVLFSAIVPATTIILLFSFGGRGRKLWLCSLQVILAGLSHLVLDLLVGVTPFPLLFPLMNVSFKLPFGILPSAGKIDLNNYYFYRNLKLEMGVLLPLFCLTYLWNNCTINFAHNTRHENLIKIFFSTLLLLCCSYFIYFNLALPR